MKQEKYEEKVILEFLNRYYKIITVSKVKNRITESHLSGRCKTTQKTLDVNQIYLETKLVLGDFVSQEIVECWYNKERENTIYGFYISTID